MGVILGNTPRDKATDIDASKGGKARLHAPNYRKDLAISVERLGI